MAHLPLNSPVLRYAAFTRHGEGGNPAGVVLDARGLDSDECLAIASTVNYSETAFIEHATDEVSDGSVATSPREFNVRYFSPLAQVAFCGHATIASAVALADRDGVGSLLFHTLAGTISVETIIGRDGISATLMSPPTSTFDADPEDVAATLQALGWCERDLDPRYPPHVSFAGNHHLILAATTRGRLADLDYDYHTLEQLMNERRWTTVHLVYAESSDLFHARDPFPPGGVVEDPATGAAAAAFGGYLRALNLVKVPGTVTIIQGEDMGRPCELKVHLSIEGNRVAVTGFASRILDTSPYRNSR